MDGKRNFNVSSVVDNRPVQGATYLVLGLCFAATISDGYNLIAASLAAPGIVKDFAISRAELAPVFSMGLFGMLVGAMISGFMGDRFGRKRGILAAMTIISIFGYACGFVENLNQLLVLRFGEGLGLGGLLPNVTALMAEFMPQKVRGAFTTYAFMGVTSGGLMPGLVSTFLVGGDWRALFFIGGTIPLVVLLPLFFFLPESLKFLALHPGRHAELRTWLKKLAPDVAVPPDAKFTLDEKSEASSLASLFEGRLKGITPSLWLAFMCIMLVNFFISSWITLVLTDIGYSIREASAIASLYHFGGIVGGVIMGLALDYLGPAVLGLFAILGCLVTGLIGLLTGSAVVTGLLVGLLGFSVLGAQVGMSAIGGLVYPTAVRSKGAGFAHSIGRIGAIIGPLLAGYFISANSSLFKLFLVPVVPLAIAAVCYFVITKIWTGRFRGKGVVSLKHLEQQGT